MVKVVDGGCKPEVWVDISDVAPGILVEDLHGDFIIVTCSGISSTYKSLIQGIFLKNGEYVANTKYKVKPYAGATLTVNK